MAMSDDSEQLDRGMAMALALEPVLPDPTPPAWRALGLDATCLRRGLKNIRVRARAARHERVLH